MLCKHEFFAAYEQPTNKSYQIWLGQAHLYFTNSKQELSSVFINSLYFL